MSVQQSVGFLRPTTTPTPDELFDLWLPQLTGAELKILLYIVRRTFGFKKDADAISLNQICEGITTRDGRVLDRGTGLCKTSAYKAIQRLEGLGLIDVERGQTHKGDSATNIYRLRFCGLESTDGLVQIGTHPRLETAPPVGEESAHRRSETHRPVGENFTPQDSDSQQTEHQETVLQATATAPPADAELETRRQAGAAAGPSDQLPPSEDSTLGTSEEAVQHLIAFGVWEREARRAVQEYRLSLRTVERACDEITAEMRRGARILNAPALLLSRLAQGWPPSEPEHDNWSSLTGEEEDYSDLSEQPARKPLPTIRDSEGHEREVYEWFDEVKSYLRLTLPEDAFHTWLAAAQVEDFIRMDSDDGESICLLTIQLVSLNAYEWVRQRLHKVIQRTVNTVLGYAIDISYTGPSEDGQRYSS